MENLVTQVTALWGAHHVLGCCLMGMMVWVVTYGLYRLLARHVAAKVLSIIAQRQDALTDQHIKTTNREIRSLAQDLLQDARERYLPLHIVAGTPAEAADLQEALREGQAATLAASYQTSQAPPARRTRRQVREEREEGERNSAPTAWEHILRDDDEDKEGQPCPTTINEAPAEPETPQKKRAAKKAPPKRRS